MPRHFLEKAALDYLARINEIGQDLKYCATDGELTKQVRGFVLSLETRLRTKLDLDGWISEVEPIGTFTFLNLLPERWRVPNGEFVAFGVAWCNPFDEEAADPFVYIRVPTADVFPQRDGLLKKVRPALIKAGLEDHIPGSDADPLWPLWQYVTLDSCQSPTGFDADKLAGQVVDAFGRLLPSAGLVDEFLRSLSPEPPLPPPAQRPLRVVAFVDTETAGTGTSAKMREFAVINAAYDATGDQVVGILDEYSVRSPKKVDQQKARSLLDRAEAIVAHNAEFDRGVVGRYLPGVGDLQWLCSLNEIDWKRLAGVTSKSLETLLCAEGLSSEQEHTALADARDLLRLMAVRRDGKTYLARLLEKSRGARPFPR